MKIFALSIVTLFASAALAEAGGVSMDLARAQGDVQCTVSQKSQSFDCTVRVAGMNKHSMELKKMEAQNGKAAGYFGIDTIKSGDYNYTLVATTDGKKKLMAVTLVTDNSSDKTKNFEASVVASQSNSLNAAHIAPISVDMNDMNAIKVNVNFIVYGSPKSKAMQPAGVEDLHELVLGKLQPYLLSLTQ